MFIKKALCTLWNKNKNCITKAYHSLQCFVVIDKLYATSKSSSQDIPLMVDQDGKVLFFEYTDQQFTLCGILQSAGPTLLVSLDTSKKLSKVTECFVCNFQSWTLITTTTLATKCLNCYNKLKSTI